MSARIREIEKNPPVEQTGNVIRLGRFTDESLARNISISYDVTVPAQTTVNARTGSGGIDVGDLTGTVDANTGSGSITVGRIAGPVIAGTGSGSISVTGAGSLNARTGSGSIRGSAVAGAVTASSGSGSVRIAKNGKGDVDVSSSSGEVEVTGVDGAARVSASSGSVVVEGRPSGPWDVHSSSGRVTLRLPPDAAFDLDARVSSGRIETAHPITLSGTIEQAAAAGQGQRRRPARQRPHLVWRDTDPVAPPARVAGFGPRYNVWYRWQRWRRTTGSSMPCSSAAA